MPRIIKKMLVLCAIVIGVALSEGELLGATVQVGVLATVIAGKCSFSNGGSISFTLNPATGGTAAGTVTQPAFKCSKDAVYAIGDNKGLYSDGTNRRMKNASLNDYIIYGITYTQSGKGSGTGTRVPMDITASIIAANYINASAGSYQDTLTFTITP
jgi:spore coat protein U-like protein